jgi:hypothetical protein
MQDAKVSLAAGFKGGAHDGPIDTFYARNGVRCGISAHERERAGASASRAARATGRIGARKSQQIKTASAVRFDRHVAA